MGMSRQYGDFMSRRTQLSHKVRPNIAASPRDKDLHTHRILHRRASMQPPVDRFKQLSSVAGATVHRAVLHHFQKGHAIVWVTSTPFKCPPACREMALMLQDFLFESRPQDACEINFKMLFRVPILEYRSNKVGRVDVDFLSGPGGFEGFG